MNGQTSPTSDLVEKIALLVEARGWNLEDFSRNSRLNRQTVRPILRRERRELRSATVAACAEALGLSVDDLRNLPLDRLRRSGGNCVPAQCNESFRPDYEHAMQPALQDWIESYPQRAKQMDGEEMDELMSLQGVGGPLTAQGVEHFAAQIERRRELVHKVRTVANTELGELLEKLVSILYEKVQPYADRK